MPVAIQNDLKNIITEENILDLTARRLITRTSMQKFLKGVPLPELHPSLNNRSKIDHMISTKHRAEHPYGQDIMGVAYMLLKQTKKKETNPYIRTVRFFNNGQYLALCGYKNQIKYLANSSYFEIDMSFKRMHGPFNEWEVCAYIERYQKIFARVFTILQTAYTYQKLFKKLFICVEQDCGHSIKFKHIHECGISCILADEHQGQALDLLSLEKALVHALPTIKYLPDACDLRISTRSDYEPTEGIPDFNCHKVTISEAETKFRLILPIEIKRKHVLGAIHENPNEKENESMLSELYYMDKSIKNAINQIYSYMVSNECQYGIIPYDDS
ncbi:14952_t:CDS:2 [Gigaspora rosea]|nr:14952_t:CDS:2 [Gigaspora rosea]